jgi:Domain of unknown function (DUF5011)/Putative Ig domain
MSFIGKIFSRSAAQPLSRSAALASIVFALLTACSGGSSDPTVVAGDFTAYGVKGSVNGQNVTLDLSGLGNCATNIENMVIGVNANGASISPDPRLARDYSQPVQFTLAAPDGTKAVYTVTVKGAACLQTPTPTPDTTPPVITVLGTNPLSLTVGTAYTEAGATCVDNKDPSCTVVTTGTVNTATVGTYTITYTATDAAGNVSSMTRTVNVVAAADPAPIAGGAFAALADMTVGDNLGNGINNINAGGVTDPLGRVIVYTVTGLPAGLSIDGNTGVISGIYDSNATFGLSENFTVTITATPAGGTHPISKTWVLSIRNDG